MIGLEFDGMGFAALNPSYALSLPSGVKSGHWGAEDGGDCLACRNWIGDMDMAPFEGAWSDEVTAYSASCINDVRILPRGTWIMNNPSSFDYEKAMREAEQKCEITANSPVIYEVNAWRGEVYCKGLSGVQKLVNCAIHSRLDWSCEYEDYRKGVYRDSNYSGKVVMMDGMLTLYEKEI